MTNARRWFADFVLDSAPLVVASATVLAGVHPDPTYNAVLMGASTYLAMIRDNDKKIFVDEFQKKLISEEILSSLEFARAAKAAIEAAANTASEEKIRKIARLLNSASATGLIQDFDAFKEYAKIVDDISPREFRILALMKHHMEGSGMFGVLPPPLTREDEKRVSKRRKAADEVQLNFAAWGDSPPQSRTTLENNWLTAKRQIKEELDASDEAVESYMLRLTRTGCVAPGIIQLYEGTKTFYRVTPLYISLESYIKQSG